MLQILYVVTALDIAEVLGREGPQTVQQLAATLGTPPIWLHMLNLGVYHRIAVAN